MAFWSKWFQSAPAGPAKPVKTEAYKGFVIEAAPYAEAGQFQLCGVIVKGEGDARQEYRFVRADRFTDREEAADVAIAKGRLIIDQQGDRLF